MLAKMGWSEGDTLGAKSEDAIKEPVSFFLDYQMQIFTWTVGRRVVLVDCDSISSVCIVENLFENLAFL